MGMNETDNDVYLSTMVAAALQGEGERIMVELKKLGALPKGAELLDLHVDVRFTKREKFNIGALPGYFERS